MGQSLVQVPEGKRLPEPKILKIKFLITNSTFKIYCVVKICNFKLRFWQSLLSLTWRDKYYDYDDDYYYDDEIYDDYYNYEDEPKRARQKARRRQSDAIDRQYGGKNFFFTFRWLIMQPWLNY